MNYLFPVGNTMLGLHKLMVRLLSKSHQNICYCYLTHWGRDKMAAIYQTTFSNAFSWTKMYEFWLKFHWGLFVRVQLTIYQHWFWYYLDQWWLDYQRIYASLGLNELNDNDQVRSQFCTCHDSSAVVTCANFIPDLIITIIIKIK